MQVLACKCSELESEVLAGSANKNPKSQQFVDGGAGAAAQFDRPCGVGGVAVDAEGNIVIDIDVALVRCHSRSDHHAQTIRLLGSLDDHRRVAAVRRSG